MASLLDTVLDVDHEHGTTRCAVLVARAHDDLPALVRVSERADNTGPSVAFAFAAVAAEIRRMLPWLSDAIWVEHSPERALASLLLRDGAERAYHLRVPATHATWSRHPAEGAWIRQLIALAEQEQPVSSRCAPG